MGFGVWGLGFGVWAVPLGGGVQGCRAGRVLVDDGVPGRADRRLCL